MFFDIHIHLRTEHVFYGKTKEGNKRRGGQESQSEGEIERGSKGGEGSLQEPICPRGGAAGSAPRTAPVFVSVQTPAPARSQAATGGHPLPSPPNLLWEERERGRREQTGRGFSILSPHLPNSALIPPHCITAIDFHLASRGTLLLAT